ncbi:MAG: class I SAM-dependent methyltransferase [Parvibaculales bacterium]
MANEQQTEFWSGSGGEYWVVNQRQMDTMLEPLGAQALARIDLNNVHHILDIGCGTGSTTLDIAARLPDGARVTGADLSVPMTDYARSRLGAEGVSNADFMTCDLQIDKLDSGKFDAAFSRFGVMFFDQPVVGFSNIRTAMKSDAQLAFVCWQTPRENLWHSLAVATAKKFIEMPAAPEPRAPGPFAFADTDYVTSILTDSGFGDIVIEPHTQTVELFSGQDVRDAAENFARINPIISAFMTEAGDDKAEPLIDGLAEALAPYHQNGALRFPSATWLVSARA